MKRELDRVGASVLVGVGHATATALVSVVIALTVLPLQHARHVAEHVWGVPQLWDLSSSALLIHAGLSACVWALVFILYKLVRLHVEERRVKRTVKLQRGSVMTETLIILPIFFLLVFGMAQLAINNIAAILANVAAYQGARAAWIWMPEEKATTKRMGVKKGIAKHKCRTAVALVMMPVAPAGFTGNPVLPKYAAKMRTAAVGAHVGPATSIAPRLADLLSGTMSLNDRVAFEGNKSMSRALDMSSFMMRTASKFTHAYHVSKCKISKKKYSVKMSYQMMIAMPLVGPVFGKEMSRNNPLGLAPTGPGLSLREGYYAKFRREFGLPKQTVRPNARLPKNKMINFKTPKNPSEGEITGKAKSGVNDVQSP